MPVLCAESVNHVSIPVNDLERAKTFYVELLGLRELPVPPTAPGHQDPAAERLGVARPGLCRLACGGLEVTLFQRPEPIDPEQWRSNGFFHYSYRMNWDQLDRLASDTDQLRQSGYNIPCEPVYRGSGNSRSMSLYIVDPEGNLFELVGRPEGSSWRTPGAAGP